MCRTAILWKVVLWTVALTGLAMGSTAMAASTSELLEKGIYTEETVGNLDEAISIYQQVVAEAAASHALAAQAQYRLGQCLLKKGKKAEATAAFEKLISDFADQKELVAKARKFVPEGIQLESAPWVDGEFMQLRYRLAGGMDIGTIIYTAQSAELDGQKIWRVGSRQIAGPIHGTSGVDADWNTFRPIKSFYNMPPLGKFSAEFKPTQIIVTVQGTAGESTKTLDETQVIYDNEQAMDVMRRLPLAPGYKVTLPILGIGNGAKIELPIEVQGKETVKVPAGDFESFKIHLGLVNQTFWIATDPHRYLVKFDANSVIAELTSFGQIKPGQQRQFEDEKLGVSLAAPSDWFFYAPAPADEKSEAKVFLLDPQVTASSVLFVAKVANLKPEEQKSLRAWADAVIATRCKEVAGYKVRPENWRREGCRFAGPELYRRLHQQRRRHGRLSHLCARRVDRPEVCGIGTAGTI